MSSSWTDPEESAWPEEAPGPTDVPTQPEEGREKGDGGSGAGEKTGEDEASRNRQEDPPA